MELFCIALIICALNVLLSLYFIVKITNKKRVKIHYIYIIGILLFVILNIFLLTFVPLKSYCSPKYFFFIFLFVFIPFIIFYTGNYHIFIKPLYQYEQTLLFLDILKIGLKKGNSPEFTISEVSQYKHHGIGRWIKRLDKHIKKHGDFAKSLSKCSKYLAFPVADTLKAGVRFGNILAVIDSSYQTVLANENKHKNVRRFFIYPFIPFTIIFSITSSLKLFILPKFHRIAYELCDGRFSTDWVDTFYLYLPMILKFVFWLYFCITIGSWVIKKLRLEIITSALDFYLIPWKRKIILKNFVTLLTTALNQGLPEDEAMYFAAEGTGNKVMVMLAKRAANKLSIGETLPTVLTRYFDPKGEFAWYYNNCQSNQLAFTESIKNWCTWLSLTAQRSEYVFYQLFSVGVLLFFGALTATVMISIFYLLVETINSVQIW